MLWVKTPHRTKWEESKHLAAFKSRCNRSTFWRECQSCGYVLNCLIQSKRNKKIENLEAAKFPTVIRCRGTWYEGKSPSLRMMVGLFISAKNKRALGQIISFNPPNNPLSWLLWLFPISQMEVTSCQGVDSNQRTLTLKPYASISLPCRNNSQKYHSCFNYVFLLSSWGLWGSERLRDLSKLILAELGCKASSREFQACALSSTLA